VTWCTKGFTSTNLAAAFLLHNLGQCCQQQVFHLIIISVPDTTDTIAYICSCSSNLFDGKLLVTLNQNFSLGLVAMGAVHLCDALITDFCAVLHQISPWESLFPAPIKFAPSELIGAPSASHSTSMSSLPTLMIPYLSSMQLYAQWYHTGKISPSHNPVNCHTVEGIIHAVG